MNPRPSGHQASANTSSRTYNGAKWVALAIALIGIALSVMMFIRTASTDERLARETLATQGAELTRLVAGLQLAGSQQAEALEGLFESSIEVTLEEFHHFARAIGGSPTSSLVFASPVHSGHAGNPSWTVLYESRSGIAGFDVGSDLGRDLVLLDAIERSLLGESPALSGFIRLPGDREAGDVALVSSVSAPDGELFGIVLAILQIDEALADQAPLLLEDGTTWRLRDVELGEQSAEVSSTEAWAGAVEVGDRGVVVELDRSSANEGPFGAVVDRLAFLGIVTSCLLGVLAYNLMNRRSANRRIANLEQTLAEKDEFLATVSHELRTPLTAVVGMLEVINDDLDQLSPGQYATMLADARDGALELERLIEDYLTAARLSAGTLNIKKEAVNLDAVFGTTIARLKLPQHLGVIVDPLGLCVGDSLRIRQIARNILRNAARHASHEIQVENVGGDSLVVIEIRNDGDPVPQELIDGLFEPVTRSPSAGRTDPIGLGLSVSRGLARRMGGDIRYSVDGKWTVFSVVLPVSARTDVVPRATREPAQSL